ncbi:MAG: hypothetical protein AVDCRST_MAG64-4537, partial [uncultured Phycisphaerae bacterium]
RVPADQRGDDPHPARAAAEPSSGHHAARRSRRRRADPASQGVCPDSLRTAEQATRIHGNAAGRRTVCGNRQGSRRDAAGRKPRGVVRPDL